MAESVKPAIAFDVYGTLGDVARIADQLEDRHDRTEFVARWRRHQLEISWLLTTMERYEDFEAVTSYALDVALAECSLRLSKDERRGLMRNVEQLETFPDVCPALERLDQGGFTLAVLSNGSPRMLDALLRGAGIRERFAAVISVDEVRAYKPAPIVYRHAAHRLGRAIGDMWLVSGNPFDAAGAKAAGMKVAKVERLPSFHYPFAGRPEIAVADLDRLAAELIEWEGSG